MQDQTHRQAHFLPSRQSANPYLDEINRFWDELTKKFPNLRAGGIRGWFEWRKSKIHRMKVFAQREPLDCKYSFAIPDDQAIDKLASLGKLIEIGAGTGYWGSVLRKKGGDILLFDMAPPNIRHNRWHGPQKIWTAVRQGDASEVKKHPDRILFMCWPPYDKPMASEALSYYKGNILAYVGHCARGNTGDPAFHIALNNEWTLREILVIPSWRDFLLRLICEVPPAMSWAEVSIKYDDFRDKLFIFERKDKLGRAA